MPLNGRQDADGDADNSGSVCFTVAGVGMFTRSSQAGFEKELTNMLRSEIIDRQHNFVKIQIPFSEAQWRDNPTATEDTE